MHGLLDNIAWHALSGAQRACATGTGDARRCPWPTKRPTPWHSARSTLREVSGVCTQPDHQGHGLARRPMHKLIRREMLRGETPFLHVMHGNTGARDLYARMGFREYRQSVARVVSQA